MTGEGNVEIRFCLLIPAYRHEEPLKRVLSSLIALGIPCLIVDDGNTIPLRETLGDLARSSSLLHFKRLEKNRGKGGACVEGFRWARELGFTHVVTLDADGQHDVRDIPKVLGLSRATPKALILGKPLFGSDVPLSRKWGRLFSRVWAWLETWSFHIGDPLYGFRCYPLEPTLRILNKWNVGKRMDFDPEIAVLLCWEGVPVLNFDTQVIYPQGGISNFRIFKDNAGLFWLNTRMMFRILFYKNRRCRS